MRRVRQYPDIIYSELAAARLTVRSGEVIVSAEEPNMGSQIPISSIEGFFNVFLYPYRCQCRLLKDASLIISVQDGDLQDDYLTVAGVPLEHCRDEPHVRSLARSILEELDAIRAPGAMVPVRATAQPARARFAQRS